jgi:hypothetical protein
VKKIDNYYIINKDSKLKREEDKTKEACSLYIYKVVTYLAKQELAI